MSYLFQSIGRKPEQHREIQGYSKQSQTNMNLKTKRSMNLSETTNSKWSQSETKVKPKWNKVETKVKPKWTKVNQSETKVNWNQSETKWNQPNSKWD